MKKGILIPFVLLFLFVLSACSKAVGEGTDCDIKGNVSFYSGEKIYHEPGDEYYDVTKIDERYGEKWFCSEEEAEKAGFRRTLR
ncbi:hypothetical protein ACFVRR_04390 [Gottfriedia sp. NPDC057948]|uniref:sunset domain-containing protein n=1 Tax=Gottfriedia sp. NPDC057948 TaxID=3346287 RepID=UPI0036DE1CFA